MNILLCIYKDNAIEKTGEQQQQQHRGIETKQNEKDQFERSKSIITFVVVVNFKP